MASLIRTLTFTTASVNAGASSSTNQTIVGNIADIVKIKVTPSNINPGELTSCYIYKHNTFASADIVYSTSSFSGNLIDPIETDGVTSTERNEGFVAKYEDLDNAQQLHIKITNSGTVAKTYTLVIEYYPLAQTPTFANLPTDPTAGMVMGISDCTSQTWGGMAVGGGANPVLVWYNGTNWTIVGK